MLRFPLRLTADLAKARFAQRSSPDVSPVQFVDSADLLHHDSNHPVSHEKIREVISSRSAAVWIGGSEPLRHPGVAHLVRAITGSGHFVFLETDGTMLRRRIHEFQPVPRFFLTVRLEIGARHEPSKGLPASASELAAEGMRAARLSGFLICVHARVQVDTELEAMAQLLQFARSQDVDGIVITPATGAGNSAAQRSKTAEARKLIRSMWWESFSRLVEVALIGERNTVQSVSESEDHVQQKTPANEEGVRVA